MRVVRIEKFGGPEVLVPGEAPDPVAGPGQVLVRLAAASVNRADVLIRSGAYHRARRPPLIPGMDGAGTVVSVGEGVTDVLPGQRVMGLGRELYAELAAIPAGHLAVLPDEVDLTVAAAVPSVWITAWYCLHRLAGIAKGETVVVHAAASGVGTAAVQVAAEAGARVIAVAGTREKAAWAASFGAVPATGEEEVAALTDGRGADVVIDAVGGPVFAQSLRQVAYGGRVVALANVALEPSLIDTRDFYPKNATIRGFQLTNLMNHGYVPREDLQEIAARIASGAYRVPIEARFPLEQAAEAHRRLEQRTTRGKLVLTMDSVPTSMYGGV
ncbi:quinone oxidoreductase family protein [Nonomuraea sediminis]|uniref:quinone oxidoreductase family protein n=1 Tax=Nonomuraea sediminis TaxID=2835864 RepID=UPI001BDBE548|nr:NADPH:quinone oxidoreductase family protein [Nonomuraea sediminis]